MTRRNVTDGQYGMLMRRLGEVARRVDEGAIPLAPVMSQLQQIIDGGPAAAQAASGLLGLAEPLCTAPVYARFVVREHFGSKKAEVKIYHNFGPNILDLVEENVPETPLDARRLKRNSVDKPILDELKEKPKVKFCQIWHAVTFGSLRKDRWYIFYAFDKDGVLWAVYVRWFDDGWDVRACSVEHSVGWHAGYFVVSC